ncbi:IS3 family transposase [Cytobacillus citreus]|uniref:IS3 family transposase n=1 Tax=Cytobacillus citreus TaxID=2833586 RepID=UPI003B82D74C
MKYSLFPFFGGWAKTSYNNYRYQWNLKKMTPIQYEGSEKLEFFESITDFHQYKDNKRSEQPIYSRSLASFSL